MPAQLLRDFLLALAAAWVPQLRQLSRVPISLRDRSQIPIPVTPSRSETARCTRTFI